MARKNYHVVKKGPSWDVEAEGSKRASSKHTTKNEAINAARELAKKQPPSEVLIHNKTGQIKDRRSYGSDPYPPKG
jgi:uncharacterized protein YdaT